MIVDSDLAGPQNPRTPALTRAAPSVRRTSTVDTIFLDGFAGGTRVVARARDLVTHRDGDATVAERASIDAQLTSGSHQILWIETTPAVPALQDLVGAGAGSGFRSRVEGVAPELRGTGSPLYFLLDDVPGATLVSGYALLFANALPPVDEEHLVARGDVCAGWAADSSKMDWIRERGRLPIMIGPPAPALVRDDDPLAWHDLPGMPPNAMRRARRLDVTSRSSPAGDPGIAVDVFFRDSYFDKDARETVVHEYAGTVTIDPHTHTVTAIDIAPDVLPYRECPAAIASADRIVGHSLAGLRAHVRETFTGKTTCTHLNDVLRGFEDLGTLIDRLGSD